MEVPQGNGNVTAEDDNAATMQRRQRLRRRRKTYLLMCALLAALILLGSILGISLVRGSGGVTLQEPAAVNAYLVANQIVPTGTNSDEHGRAVEFVRDQPIPTDESSDLEKYKYMERYVLALMYYQLNGPDWTFQYNFLNKGTDACYWHGRVRVSATTSRINGAFCYQYGDPVVAIEMGE